MNDKTRGATGRKASAPADADHASGQDPLELVFDCEEGGVRTSVAERDSEALTRAHGDVDVQLTWSSQHRQREQVSGAHDETLQTTPTLL